MYIFYVAAPPFHTTITTSSKLALTPHTAHSTHTHKFTIMSEHNYKFNIAMSCGGCSGAVERVLKKLEGDCSPPLLAKLEC